MTLKLIVASASPRRKELLQQLEIRFQQKTVAIDETPYESELPKEYVTRMAHEKAEAAWAKWGKPDRLILSSDTTVVIDNKILGKPSGYDDFRTMMQSLSGRQHQVLTSVVVKSDTETKSVLSETHVYFCGLTDSDIDWYWHTGEPPDKAGGYGIQGLGARFVRRIDGSFTGVMGLPLFETAEILSNFGILTNNKE